MDNKLIYIIVAPCDVDRSTFTSYFRNKEYSSKDAIKQAVLDFIKIDRREDDTYTHKDFNILPLDYFLDDLNSDCIDIDNSWVVKVTLVGKEIPSDVVELTRIYGVVPEYIPVCLSRGKLVAVQRSNVDKGEYKFEVFCPVSKQDLSYCRSREYSRKYCLKEWKEKVADGLTTDSLDTFVRDKEIQWDMYNDQEAYMGKPNVNVFTGYEDLRKIADDYAKDNPYKICDVATWIYEEVYQPVKSEGDIIFNKGIYRMIEKI